MSADGITTGVLGGRWRATVSSSGAVQPWDDSPVLDWFVAADDRWHTPAVETTVRQTRVEGTPVVETRLRIPKGDAVHRVWSVADGAGMTLVEVTNESPMPIAVAFSRGDVLTMRPPTDIPAPGIDLPAGSIVLPVGHQASVTVALSHSRAGAGALPVDVSPAMQVVRGWTTVADRAGRLVLPDAALVAGVMAARCELALTGPVHPDDDPAGFLVGMGQVVRMGELPDDWLPDVAHAVELAVKGGDDDWRVGVALDAAALVLTVAGERRALRDLTKVRAQRLRQVGDPPATAPDHSVWLLAWIDAWTVSPAGALLPLGLPDAWLGAAVEVYDMPVGASSRVSFALRWHAARPAVLWETTGDAIELSAPVMAPMWRSMEPSGETLWPVPPNVLEGSGAQGSPPGTPEQMGGDDGPGVSFS